MHIHFIAIGGSAMHNLAIALKRQGYQVTGSDDEILDPSKSRLEREGILPAYVGWKPEMITKDVSVVILGMHAREDNPELLRAKELGLSVFSYPEYLYEASKNKIRVVIGGSHGKTTITSMILHVCKKIGFPLDFMVGAQLEGYDCMVQITDSAKYILLEGDEYLSSPIDRRPKFHLYKPHIALISGIAWDHINVFPTFENYIDQFRLFIKSAEEGAQVIYNQEDSVLNALCQEAYSNRSFVAYKTPAFEVKENGSVYFHDGIPYKLNIFGEHNLQNLQGAMEIMNLMGVDKKTFLFNMQDFSGAAKRLQKVVEGHDFTMYKDFAHSPSKLGATVKAVKQQFPNRSLVACMELHTFSSLNKAFLPQYLNSMDMADKALVYFNPKVVSHKKLPMISCDDVAASFGGNVEVVNETAEVMSFIHEHIRNSTTLLMMSSGNFDGINFDELGAELIENLD